MSPRGELRRHEEDRVAPPFSARGSSIFILIFPRRDSQGGITVLARTDTAIRGEIPVKNIMFMPQVWTARFMCPKGPVTVIAEPTSTSWVNEYPRPTAF